MRISTFFCAKHPCSILNRKAVAPFPRRIKIGATALRLGFNESLTQGSRSGQPGAEGHNRVAVRGRTPYPAGHFSVVSESIRLSPTLAETSCVYRSQVSRLGPCTQRRRDHCQRVSKLSNLSATDDEPLKHTKELPTPFIQARPSHRRRPNPKSEMLKPPTLRRSCLLPPAACLLSLRSFRYFCA